MRIVFLFLALCITSFAAETGGTIAVVGESKALVTPDYAEWTFVIHAKGKTIEDAALEAQAAQDRMMARLGDLKIPRDGLVTEGMSQGPSWRSDQGQRVPDGFFSRRSFKLSISNLELYGAITEKFFLDSHIEVLGVSYSSKDRAAAERAQILLALSDAKERAEAIATKINARLGRVLFVQANGPAQIFDMSKLNSEASNLPPLAPIVVSASVQVSYEIQQ